MRFLLFPNIIGRFEGSSLAPVQRMTLQVLLKLLAVVVAHGEAHLLVYDDARTLYLVYEIHIDNVRPVYLKKMFRQPLLQLPQRGGSRDRLPFREMYPHIITHRTGI